jgi:hypothetical protein
MRVIRNKIIHANKARRPGPLDQFSAIKKANLTSSRSNRGDVGNGLFFGG